MKKLYTEPEIVLCTFIARFGRKHFSEEDIVWLEGRSKSSIELKVQNIASMLIEEGYRASSDVSPLSGKPPGQKGRKTNWDVVIKLVNIGEDEFKRKCFQILSP